jgi:hypothetical protein
MLKTLFYMKAAFKIVDSMIDKPAFPDQSRFKLNLLSRLLHFLI